MGVFLTALAGMRKAEERVQVAVERIAVSPLPASPEPADTVDLSAEMVALLAAKSAHAASVKIAQTADEMSRHTMEIFG